MITYTETNSCTSVQRAVRRRFHKGPPPQTSLQRWYDNFEKQGCICKKKCSGHLHVSVEAVGQVEATFNQSPRKSAEGKV
jgi:hypothetical protein